MAKIDCIVAVDIRLVAEDILPVVDTHLVADSRPASASDILLVGCNHLVVVARKKCSAKDRQWSCESFAFVF